MSVGSIVRKARLACDLTQKTMAERTGMAQSIISAIEHGARNPTIRTLRRLAKALGLRLVVRLENESGSGFEWSTSHPEAKNSIGFAGTQPSERDKMLSAEPVSQGSG